MVLFIITLVVSDNLYTQHKAELLILMDTGTFTGVSATGVTSLKSYSMVKLALVSEESAELVPTTDTA